MKREVPKYEIRELKEKVNKYCLIIPILNEKGRIEKELDKAKKNNIHKKVDIIICDGNSTDGSNNVQMLKKLGVNTLLIKKDIGKQGAQLRMGFSYALTRGYEGIITIDGNNKDSIEDTLKFIEKLDEGYDFVQGSRFVKGGKHNNTPKLRKVAIKLLHAPIISLTAGKKYTDTTNNFRAYSKKYLVNKNVNPFRKIFNNYELLAYLSVRADQLNLKTCEIPVKREYPKSEKIPTKISFFKGNYELFKVLFSNLFGKYNPDKKQLFKMLLNIYIILIFICILIIRIAFYNELLFGNKTYDSFEYIGINTLNIFKEGVNISRLPLYPFIIDIFQFFFTNYEVYLSYFQIIVSFISLIYFYKICYNLSNKKILSVIFTFVYGISPCIIGYDKTILTESLSLSLFIIWLYYYIKSINNINKKNLILIPTFALILIFIKPSFLIILFLLTVCYLFRFIVEKDKKYLIGLSTCLLCGVALIIYGTCYYYKFGVFNLSNTIINQKFVISIQRGYYKSSSNNEIKSMIDNYHGNNYFEVIWDYQKNHSDKEYITSFNKFNKEVYKKNKSKVLLDGIKLGKKIRNNKYIGYWYYSEKPGIDSKNIIIHEKLENYLKYKIIYVYIGIFISLCFSLFKWIKVKKTPYIDLSLLALSLVTMVSTLLNTNAEYERISIICVPILFIELLKYISYIIKRKISLPLEDNYEV